MGTILAGSTYNGFAMPLTNVLSPLSLLFVSEVLTAFFVLLSFGAVPTFRALLKVQRRHVTALIAVGLLSSVLGPLLWFVGLHLAGAVNASILGKVDLVIMMLLAHFLLGEKLHRGHLLGLGVIVGGLFIVSYNNMQGGISLSLNDGVILLSVLCFAAGSIVFRMYLHELEPHVVLFARCCIAVTTFFLLAPFVSHPFIQEVARMPLDLLPVLLAFGFVSRFLNIFLYYQAVDRLPVTTVSPCCTLDIVGSMLFAYWFLGENLEWYHLAGGLCVIAGNLLLELHGMFPSAKHQERHLRHRVGHRP